MKSFFNAISLAAVLLLSGLTAHAGDHNDRAERREARAEQRQQEHADRQERKVGQRQVAEPQPEGGHRGAKMSPEERRALRRQINEAGQDIYTRK